MNLFESKKKKFDRVRTASDVKTGYDSHIEHFLKRVGGQSHSLNPFQEREEPLEALLKWADNLLFEKQDLTKQLNKLKDRSHSAGEEIKERNQTINQLKQTVEILDSDLRQVTSENRTNKEAHDREIEKLTRAHTKNVEKERRAWQDQISAMQRSWDEEKEKAKRQSERDILTERRKYDHDIAVERSKRDSDVKKWSVKYDHDMGLEKQEQQRQKDKHKDHLISINAEHSAETSKLVGQLLVNQKDYQGWPDDKMKLKFKEVQGLIESITAPSNREFLIPPSAELSKHLDPTDFIGRVGRGKSHFFLQNVIWTVLVEQFFSSAFGFGALGPGKPQRELMKVYHASHKLLESPTSSDLESSDGEVPSIFYHDELANNWRSATFQCIYAAVATGDSNILAAKLMSDNVNQTVTRIMNILSEVASLSSSRVQSGTENEVQQMVDLASSIAIQFGAHRAQLKLLIPLRGEQIKIGESYHDCEDGDAYKGSAHVVDLVTVPGLEKIGDGRSDMSSSRALIPCEFYPTETN